MYARVPVDGREVSVDLARPVDLALELDFSGPQPRHFGAPRASSRPFETPGFGFKGSVERGSSCNCDLITIVPHCNGTHTEAVGHLTRERLDAYCRRINRDPGEIRRCVSTAYLIGHDEAALRRRGAVMQQLIRGLASLDLSAVPDALRRDGWIVGTPDQIIVQLQALADEGVERLILQHNDPTDFEALELMACEVMPALAA